MVIDGLSMNEHARRFLSETNISLPKELNVALQNVFTKTRDGDTVDKNKFRKRVIKTIKEGDSPAKYIVMPDKGNAIYNTLCLLYLIGTGETKKLFQHYEATSSRPEKRNFSILKKQTDQQYLEFFCLGVVRENIDKIIECLCSVEFDLFTDKLPSPFSNLAKSKYDLTPMLNLYGQVIPWNEYIESYENAEAFFAKKDYQQAKKVLKNLEHTALLRLPVIESLNKKIKAQEDESKEAWEYFQKILN
tara:strand:+ start:510 stop:1250 length:741 start_codon:yes stop_codon:yes gene_type:complete